MPRSSVSLLLGFTAMLRVSLVSRVSLLLDGCTIICLGVYRHLVSGHEISRLQHCPSSLSGVYYARYTRIKPNSITLAGSELAPNMFGASSELVRSWLGACSEPTPN